LCGISTIITNHWSVKPEASFEFYEHLMKCCLTEGLYLGAALRRYQENKEIVSSTGERTVLEKKAIYKFNPVTYGVPIIRIV